MKVYLSGPMSWYPSFNFPAFIDAAATLRRRGHEVLSPVELDTEAERAVSMASPDGNPDTYASHGLTKQQFLDRDVELIVANHETIDAVVTLTGWEKSSGAKYEVASAALYDIPRLDYDPRSELGFSTSVELFPPDPAGLAEDASSLYDAASEWVKFQDNPLRQRTVTGGVKDNRGKLPIDLVPYEALKGAADVLAYGAVKYKPNNWRLGLKWSETWSSLQRHLWAWKEGEDLDPETGKPHIDHAMCQMLFLATYVHGGYEQFDDRWTSTDHEKAKA